MAVSHLLVLAVLACAAGLACAKDIREPYSRLTENAWYPSPGLGFIGHGLKYEIRMHDLFVIAFEVINGTFVVAMASNSTGWLGFGPSATGSMVGANPCVILESNGTMIAQAMHSDVAGAPSMNGFQNCDLLEYNSVNGESYARIRRPVYGCKPEDQDVSDLHSQRFVAAWGATQAFNYHGDTSRTTIFFNAFTGPDPTYELPDDAVAYDAVLAGPWTLPSDLRDIYVCRGHRFPADRRYHVVRMDPIVYDIAPAVYHHVIVYGCTNNALPPAWWDGENQYCPGSGGVDGCRIFVTGWATGQQSLYMYPAGLPMGAGEGATSEFVVENHIDHPQLTPGIVDEGWGLRLWYTPTLLDIEGGTFGVYVGIPVLGIPPQSVNYLLHGNCGTACTSAGFPPEGIVVSAISPHEHSAGKGSFMKVIRNIDGVDVEIAELHSQTHWDANWQGPHVLIREIRVFPGDRILAMCHYDTTDRDVPTYFGEGYGDEMCTPYLSYYPRVTMSICSEWPGYLPENANSTGITYCDAFPWVAPVPNRSYVPLPPPTNICSK